MLKLLTWSELLQKNVKEFSEEENPTSEMLRSICRLKKVSGYLTESNDFFLFPSMIRFPHKVWSVASNDSAALILTESSKVYALGSDNKDSGVFLSLKEAPEPIELLDLSGLLLQRVSLGSVHAGGISSNGQLILWGSENKIQKLPFIVETLRNFICKDLVCLNSFTCVSTQGGFLYVLGNFGKKIKNSISYSEPVSPLNNVFVKSFACSSQYIFALSDSGNVYAVDQDFNKLQLPSSTYIESIYCFDRSLVGVSEDQTLFEWAPGFSEGFEYSGTFNVVEGTRSLTLISDGNNLPLLKSICRNKYHGFVENIRKTFQNACARHLNASFNKIKNFTPKINSFVVYKLWTFLNKIYTKERLEPAFKLLKSPCGEIQFKKSISLIISKINSNILKSYYERWLSRKPNKNTMFMAWTLKYILKKKHEELLRISFSELTSYKKDIQNKIRILNIVLSKPIYNNAKLGFSMLEKHCIRSSHVHTCNSLDLTRLTETNRSTVVSRRKSLNTSLEHSHKRSSKKPSKLEIRTKYSLQLENRKTKKPFRKSDVLRKKFSYLPVERILARANERSNKAAVFLTVLLPIRIRKMQDFFDLVKESFEEIEPAITTINIDFGFLQKVSAGIV